MALQVSTNGRSMEAPVLSLMVVVDLERFLSRLGETWDGLGLHRMADALLPCLAQTVRSLRLLGTDCLIAAPPSLNYFVVF